jgi:hypothetical protein
MNNYFGNIDWDKIFENLIADECYKIWLEHEW